MNSDEIDETEIFMMSARVAKDGDTVALTAKQARDVHDALRQLQAENRALKDKAFRLCATAGLADKNHIPVRLDAFRDLREAVKLKSIQEGQDAIDAALQQERNDG